LGGWRVRAPPLRREDRNRGLDLYRTHLYGRTLNERAQALIGVAHPDDPEELAKQWRDARAGLG
jgi:hypothetical protein